MSSPAAVTITFSAENPNAPPVNFEIQVPAHLEESLTSQLDAIRTSLEHRHRLGQVTLGPGTMTGPDWINQIAQAVDAQYQAMAQALEIMRESLNHPAEPILIPQKQPPARDAFEKLADEWLKGRPRGVNVRQMTEHPAYQQIIQMGEPAVPWILDRLDRETDHWFPALSAITGANPVPPNSKGNLPDMTAAWLHWGRLRGHIPPAQP